MPFLLKLLGEGGPAMSTASGSSFSMELRPEAIVLPRVRLVAGE